VINKIVTANNQFEPRARFVGFKMALVERMVALHRLDICKRTSLVKGKHSSQFVGVVQAN